MESTVARAFAPRRVVLLIVLLLVVVVALFGLERASTGPSTVSRISFLPLSAHVHSHHNGADKDDHKGADKDDHKGADKDDHKPPPPPCNRAPKNKHCRPPSGV